MEIDFNEKHLAKMLQELYKAQQHILFQDMVMQIFAEQNGLREEQIITVLKKMIQRKWLVVDGVKEKLLLRPGYVMNFPVVISRAGLEYLEQQGLK